MPQGCLVYTCSLAQGCRKCWNTHPPHSGSNQLERSDMQNQNCPIEILLCASKMLEIVIGNIRLCGLDGLGFIIIYERVTFRAPAKYLPLGGKGGRRDGHHKHIEPSCFKSETSPFNYSHLDSKITTKSTPI